jgi:hypothetical protein
LKAGLLKYWMTTRRSARPEMAYRRSPRTHVEDFGHVVLESSPGAGGCPFGLDLG